MDLFQYISIELEKEGYNLKRKEIDGFGTFGSGYFNLYIFKNIFQLEDKIPKNRLHREIVLKNKEKNISISIKNKTDIKLFFHNKEIPIHEQLIKYAFNYLPYIEDYIKKQKIELKFEDIHPKEVSLLLLSIKHGLTKKAYNHTQHKIKN